jgi:hypothetical protein
MIQAYLVDFAQLHPLTWRAVRRSRHANDMATCNINDNHSFFSTESEANLSLCILTNADVTGDVQGSVDGVLG